MTSTGAPSPKEDQVDFITSQIWNIFAKPKVDDSITQLENFEFRERTSGDLDNASIFQLNNVDLTSRSKQAAASSHAIGAFRRPITKGRINSVTA